MKKYRLPILVGVVLLILLKVGWDHRPWKKVIFQGYVEGEYVHVASPVSGRLEELKVHRGESVQAGQTLFQLEPDPEKQQQAEADAKARLAVQNADRSRNLIKTNSISSQDLDKAESELKAANEAMAQIAWRLKEKSQSSEEAGYVQDTFFVKGEWVEQGRPVVSVLPPGNVKIRFFVHAQQRADLRIGQPVRVKIFGGSEPIDATLTYLSSDAEYTPPVIYSNDTRATLTFLVEAKPKNSGDISRLTPGQPVEVVLP
jgi:HlyD family secretion protein